MSDLQAVIGGVAQGPQSGNLSEFIAVLARACSVFLRKMVLGERGTARKSRVLNDDICRTAGLSFDRIRKITKRTPLNVSLGLDGGYFRAEKLNESTLQPEAVYTSPIGPQKLEWAGLTGPRAGARSRRFVSACSTSPLSVHPGMRGAIRKGITQRTAPAVAPPPAKPVPGASHMNGTETIADAGPYPYTFLHCWREFDRS